MLLALTQWLAQDVRFFNVFNYITLRTVLAAMTALFLSLAIANAVAAIWICRLLPQEFIASIGRQIFRLLYRVEVKGMENFRAAGRKAVIVANHTSLLDGPLLSVFLPERASFAINTHVAKTWWASLSFPLFNMIPIDPTNPMALRVLVDELKRGRKVVIFPEGRLTVTGALSVASSSGATALVKATGVQTIGTSGAVTVTASGSLEPASAMNFSTMAGFRPGSAHCWIRAASIMGNSLVKG